MSAAEAKRSDPQDEDLTDGEVEIEVPAEPDEGDDDAPAAKAEPEPKSAEQGIEELKEELERKKREAKEALEQRRTALAERAEAEKRFAEAERKAATQQGQIHNSQYQQVLSALETVEGKLAQSKRDYADAMRSGDYDKAAEIQADMALHGSAVLQLRQGKSQWEAYLRNPSRQQQVRQQPAQVQHADPVEAAAHAMSQGGAVRAADWVRKNPDFIRDAGKLEQMKQAHYSALGEGLKEETDAYFSHINKRLGLDVTEQKAPPPERKAQPAAPTSRQAVAPNRTQTKVVLTAVQRQTARDLDMTDNEYAQNLLRLRREGRVAS